ncbi:hypothetical protein IWW51_001551, partial [Coemansia sp. RSA 2702]
RRQRGRARAQRRDQAGRRARRGLLCAPRPGRDLRARPVGVPGLPRRRRRHARRGRRRRLAAHRRHRRVDAARPAARHRPQEEPGQAGVRRVRGAGGAGGRLQHRAAGRQRVRGRQRAAGAALRAGQRGPCRGCAGQRGPCRGCRLPRAPCARGRRPGCRRPAQRTAAPGAAGRHPHRLRAVDCRERHADGRQQALPPRHCAGQPGAAGRDAGRAVL